MVCYLIDDDRDDQEIFAMALKEVDKKVHLVTADSGIDALETLRGKHLLPDIIFLDINMPRMDGWQCLGQLNQMEHLAKTPIVIYSTSESGIGIRARSDFHTFLTKQPKITELARKLNELFIHINP